jgi:hypothetical protein
MRYHETQEDSSMAGDPVPNPIHDTTLDQDQMEGPGTENKTHKKKRNKETSRDAPPLKMLKKC